MWPNICRKESVECPLAQAREPTHLMPWFCASCRLLLSSSLPFFPSAHLSRPSACQSGTPPIALRHCLASDSCPIRSFPPTKFSHCTNSHHNLCAALGPRSYLFPALDGLSVSITHNWWMFPWHSSSPCLHEAPKDELLLYVAMK